MQITSLPPGHIELLLSAIRPRLAPCTVYVFGGRGGGKSFSALGYDGASDGGTTHYDVLVFSGKPCVAAGIGERILSASSGQVTATVLVHNVRQLHTGSTCMKWFFHKVLRDGFRLCLDTGKVPYMRGSSVPVRDHVLVLQYWLKCEAVAAQYLEAADCGRLEVELIKVSMLHTAAAFVALGLIRVFLGYTPDRAGLKFLFGLCAHFTGLPAGAFPSGDEDGARRLAMLCAPPAMLQHWDRLAARGDDFEALHNGCLEFLEKGRALALEAIGSLIVNKG